MREKHVALWALELLVAVCCLLWAAQGVERALTVCIIGGLGLACGLSLGLLLTHIGAPTRLRAAVTALCVMGCAALGIELMFPLAAALVIELCDTLCGRGYYIPVSLICIALLALIFPPDLARLLTALLVSAALYCALWVTCRLEDSRTALEQRREEAERLHEKLNDNRRLIATLDYAARLEERNRLAARIHDKIGHGVSGSIILLEAALLNMSDGDGKARGAVQQAVNGLRASVDDIRSALREERSTGADAGMAELEAELVRFSDKHRIKTALKCGGRVQDIPPGVWRCIYDNLLEAMTNLLKHSAATRLDVAVTAENRLVRAEFRDNGGKTSFHKGMGLQNMEERAALMGGRCFFKSDERGFSVVQVFTLK